MKDSCTGSGRGSRRTRLGMGVSSTSSSCSSSSLDCSLSLIGGGIVRFLDVFAIAVFALIASPNTFSVVTALQSNTETHAERRGSTRLGASGGGVPCSVADSSVSSADSDTRLRLCSRIASVTRSQTRDGGYALGLALAVRPPARVRLGLRGDARRRRVGHDAHGAAVAVISIPEDAPEQM